MLPRVSGPSEEGPDAYAVAHPHRGIADELVWESLCYSTPEGYRPLFLDLHVPRPSTPDGGPCPLVVWVHGGGWTSGSRRRFPVSFEEGWLLERIVLAGFAVALVDYRLAAEVRFPGPVDDVCAGLRWLSDHADDFGYDARRTVLWGESAGAHLALLAAAAEVGTPDVAAVVDWYGPTDLHSLVASSSGTEQAGGEPALSPDMRRVMEQRGWDVEEASPARVVRADMPPVFIAHGRDDAMVSLAQSEILRDRLAELGVPVEYHEVDGGHVFEGADVLLDVIARSLDFLGRTLGADLGPHPDSSPAMGNAAGGQGFLTPAGGTTSGASPVRVEDRTIDRNGEAVPLRITRPAADSQTVVVYLHPGSEGEDGAAARVSVAVPAIVVELGHRFAAERPLPAGQDSCMGAVTWVHEHLAELGGSRLVLAGDGPGRDFALATALRCRDVGIPVAAVFLSSPLVEPMTTRADLRGLCPVILGVGALDPLLEVTLRFVYRLEQSGVPTRFRIFPTLGHAYCAQVPRSAVAERACAEMTRCLSQLLGDGTLA